MRPLATECIEGSLQRHSRKLPILSPSILIESAEFKRGHGYLPRMRPARPRRVSSPLASPSEWHLRTNRTIPQPRLAPRRKARGQLLAPWAGNLAKGPATRELRSCQPSRHVASVHQDGIEWESCQPFNNILSCTSHPRHTTTIATTFPGLNFVRLGNHAGSRAL